MCGIQLWEKDNDDYVIDEVPLWILSGMCVSVCVCMCVSVCVYSHCVVLWLEMHVDSNI